MPWTNQSFSVSCNRISKVLTVINYGSLTLRFFYRHSAVLCPCCFLVYSLYRMCVQALSPALPLTPRGGRLQGPRHSPCHHSINGNHQPNSMPQSINPHFLEYCYFYYLFLTINTALPQFISKSFSVCNTQ